MSRANNSHEPKYIAELRGTKPDDRLMFPVSTGSNYYWGRHLSALATRLADCATEQHRISGISSDSKEQHTVGHAVFLVAGYLQRWTLYIQELAKIMRNTEIILQKLSERDSSWEQHIRLNIKFSKEAKTPWELEQAAAWVKVQNTLIEAVKAALEKVNQFENKIEEKIRRGDTSWEQDIRDHLDFQGTSTNDVERELKIFLSRSQEKIISAVKETQDWKRVYETAVLNLFRSHQACFIFSEEENWVEVYRNAVRELCVIKAKTEGSSWAKQFDAVVSGSNGFPVILNEYSNKQVFYQSSDDDRLDVIQWETILEDPDSGFQKKRDLVQKAFDSNTKDYNNIVLTAAEGYLKSFLDKDRKKCGFPEEGAPSYKAFYAEALRLSIEYILEESAVFWIYIESGKIDGLAYPFTENETNGLLYRCITQLCELVKAKSEDAAEGVAINVRPVTLVYGKSTKLAKKSLSAEQIHSPSIPIAQSIPVQQRSSSPLPIRGGLWPEPEQVAPIAASEGSGSDDEKDGQNREDTKKLANKFLDGLKFAAAADDKQILALYLSTMKNLTDLMLIGGKQSGLQPHSDTSQVVGIADYSLLWQQPLSSSSPPDSANSNLSPPTPLVDLIDQTSPASRNS